MIGIDTFEPVELELLITSSVPTIRASFNSKGLPDYNWIAIDGHRIGVSRKQAGELLGSLDATEEQLRRDIIKMDEMYLLTEGVYGPTIVSGKPGMQEWLPTKDNKFLRPGHKYRVSSMSVHAWLYQLDKSGITCIPTFNLADTATTLVAMYNNSQKLEHNTLQRYIKPKIRIEPWNQHVLTLMGISGVELGEKKARALVDRYLTVWQIAQQEPEELAMTEGVGIVIARKLLEALGRRL